MSSAMVLHAGKYMHNNLIINKLSTFTINYYI